MSVIRSIPTTYNGRTFRSKLEARTAKLLDDAEIRWVYEPEGLRCFNTLYLPDFFLTECRTFLEVKGTVDDDALIKMDALARAANNAPRTGRFAVDTMEIERGNAGGRLPMHVVMLDPTSIDEAERGLDLRGFYAPAAHSGLHGGWQGRFCASDTRAAVVNACPRCHAVGFLWSEGLPFCYGCGHLLGAAPDGPGAGAAAIADECLCGGTFNAIKVDRVPGVGVLRQFECDRCSHVRGESVSPYPGVALP